METAIPTDGELEILMGLFIDNFLKFTKSYLINNYMITRHRESLGAKSGNDSFLSLFHWLFSAICK